MRLFYLLLLCLPLTVILSCKKEKNPSVFLVSATPGSDGSILMSARVEPNKNDINFAGFCYSKQSNPEYDAYSSYVSAPVSNNSFSAILPESNFESYTGYYVRPFVKTSYGAYYGKETYFAQVQQSSVTPPCSHPDNYISLGVNYPPAQQIYSTTMYSHFDYFDLKAQSNNHTIRIEFPIRPKTGIYTTHSYISHDYPGRVRVFANSSLALSGSSVYVNETSKGKYEITLCQVPWKLGSATAYMNAKIMLD